MLRTKHKFVSALGTTLLILVASISLQARNASGKIVFTSNRTGSWQVYSMNPDGNDVIQITNLASGDDQLFPASPLMEGISHFLTTQVKDQISMSSMSMALA